MSRIRSFSEKYSLLTCLFRRSHIIYNVHFQFIYSSVFFAAYDVKEISYKVKIKMMQKKNTLHQYCLYNFRLLSYMFL